MPTEALPGERQVVLVEILNELEELLTAGRSVDEGTFRAIAMLIGDAILDGDDQSLEIALEQIKRICASRRGDKYLEAPHVGYIEIYGRLLTYIDVIAHTLQRIVSQALLAELTEGSPKRLLLEALSQGTHWTVADLAAQVRLSPRPVMSALGELLAASLVVARQLGPTRYWEITPKGRNALLITRP
jgi:hypothetical protein